MDTHGYVGRDRAAVPRRRRPAKRSGQVAQRGSRELCRSVCWSWCRFWGSSAYRTGRQAQRSKSGRPASRLVAQYAVGGIQAWPNSSGRWASSQPTLLLLHRGRPRDHRPTPDPVTAEVSRRTPSPPCGAPKPRLPRTIASTLGNPRDGAIGKATDTPQLVLQPNKQLRHTRARVRWPTPTTPIREKQSCAPPQQQRDARSPR